MEIKLNKSPTTVITGNSGAGKSTILDAIYFALFGKPFRNINIPNLPNSINNGDMITELEFSISKVNYKIIRGLKPKIFEIYENGIMVNQDAAVKDYQKHLEQNILGGLNENVFKQVVILGSADYKPFMQLPAASRREVIEELLDIKIFSHMMEIVKERQSSFKEKLKELDYSIELESEKIKIHQTKLDETKRSNKSKQETLKEEILSAENTIKELTEEINSLQTKKSGFTEKLKLREPVDNSLRELNNLQISLSNNMKQTDKTIDFFGSHDECPTCKQNITSEYKGDIVHKCEDKKKQYIDGLSKVANEISKKAEFIKTFDKIQSNVEKIDRMIYKFQTDISALNKQIKTYSEDIIALSDSDSENQTKSIITELSDNINRLKNSRVEIMETRTYYDVVSGMLKDGGIKTKIIREYIPVINKLINEYLTQLGLPVEFTLDEQFNEVIKSRYRDSFQYNNFSEGEKARVDVAILLTWREIAKRKSTLATNLLVMDEIMDSSLDAFATEELTRILMEMDKNTNVFVISHRTDLTDKFRSHIHFEKVGNFSKMSQAT